MRILLLLAALILLCPPVHAEFLVTSAIVEFTGGGPRQQDIELVSRSKDNDYIVSEVSEVIDPGEADETRRKIESPDDGMLLVTPDKTILVGGGRKVLRFVLLKEPDAREHVYRVAVKPVIRGVGTQAAVGLKILVGYEVLVIIRPAVPSPAYIAERHGSAFTVINTGNTDILFQNGHQCQSADTCKPPPVLRAYPGQHVKITLPFSTPVSYSVWDGKETVERQFP